MRPSAKVSVASAARPPADTPPTSATWMSVPAKNRTPPSANTGRNTRMSLAWIPPRYGSFIANTSPGRIVASGHVLDERRERAPQARGVHEAGRGRQRDQLRVGVEDRRARVGAFLDERAVRGAHHDDARLLGGHEQRAADHLRGDDVVDARRRRTSSSGRPDSRVAYGARVVFGRRGGRLADVVEVDDPCGGMMPTSKT